MLDLPSEFSTENASPVASGSDVRDEGISQRDLPMPAVTTSVAADSGEIRLGTDKQSVWMANGEIRIKEWDRNEILDLLQHPAVTTEVAVPDDGGELAGPNSSVITVDGGTNGRVAIEGWDRNEIHVRAKVRGWCGPDAVGSRLTDHQGAWSVSYQVMVPHQSNLSLKTINGGIKLSDVHGRIDFRAINGSISLVRVAGEVSGRTTNGNVDVNLAGARWDGEGLDVETTNGSVTITIPDTFQADLETGTINGVSSVDFPLVVQDRINDHYSRTTLNGGGALIRAVTTNGGVVVRRGG